MGLYNHSPIRLRGVVLTQLRTGTTLLFTYNNTKFHYYQKMNTVYILTVLKFLHSHPLKTLIRP
jgi:hypothetical protein